MKQEGRRGKTYQALNRRGNIIEEGDKSKDDTQDLENQRSILLLLLLLGLLLGRLHRLDGLHHEEHGHGDDLEQVVSRAGPLAHHQVHLARQDGRLQVANGRQRRRHHVLGVGHGHVPGHLRVVVVVDVDLVAALVQVLSAAAASDAAATWAVVGVTPGAWWKKRKSETEKDYKIDREEARTQCDPVFLDTVC